MAGKVFGKCDKQDSRLSDRIIDIYTGEFILVNIFSRLINYR